MAFNTNLEHTCYSGCNNTHFDSPPLMSDGGLNTNWNTAARINKSIRDGNNIKTNSQYRHYLINNAQSIMNGNRLEACKLSGYQHSYDNSPYRQENSDLKNIYLSREELNARMVAPIISQEKLLEKGFPRAK